MAAGHLDARRYPLARLMLEYALLRQLENRRLHEISLAIHHSVMATQPTKGNRGWSAFKSFLKSLIR